MPAGYEAKVLRVAAVVGFDETDLTGENTVDVYRRYGIDLLARPRLTFRDA
jgi:adenylate cyclase class 2